MKSLEILPGIEIIYNVLYLKSSKTLIIADFHIGYEEAINKQGVLIPRTQFKETIKKLEHIFKELKIKKVIINGDLKHEFGEISLQEWKQALAILDLIIKHCPNVILVKGNHDTILSPIAKKRNLKILDYYKIKDTLIMHGHKLIKNKDFQNSKILIISHEHPSISFRKDESFKCFLLGKYKNKKLIVTPSFNPIIEGSNILKEKPLSPFLKQNLDNFQVFITADKVYDFKKIKNIKQKL
jgi:putative SbcD/Mre11-related phosphoesterase